MSSCRGLGAAVLEHLFFFGNEYYAHGTRDRNLTHTGLYNRHIIRVSASWLQTRFGAQNAVYVYNDRSRVKWGIQLRYCVLPGYLVSVVASPVVCLVNVGVANKLESFSRWRSPGVSDTNE